MQEGTGVSGLLKRLQQCRERPANARKRLFSSCISRVISQRNRCPSDCTRGCPELPITEEDDELEQVLLTMPVCKHAIWVSIRLTEEVQRDPTRCTAPCKTQMDCRHECQATCGDCIALTLQVMNETAVKPALIAQHQELIRELSDGAGSSGGSVEPISDIQLLQNTVRIHKPCLQQCHRQMLCGHLCSAACHPNSKECPGCEAECDRVCLHSKCSQPCGQVCSPCWEACPNPGCTSVCSAPCNLLPACGPDVRRCSRMLTCSNGHRVRCPSIAGLPCPAKLFCLTCAKEGLPEEDGRCSGSCQIDCVFSFAESSEEELDNEPVLCHDSCGHMFTAEFADKVFNLEEAYRLDAGGRCVGLKPVTQRMSAPTCPMCRRSFSFSQRYGRIENAATLFKLDWKFSQAQAAIMEQAVQGVDVAELSSMAQRGELELQGLTAVTDQLTGVLQTCLEEAPSAQIAAAASTLPSSSFAETPVAEAPGGLPSKVVVQCRQQIAQQLQLLVQHFAAKLVAALQGLSIPRDNPDAAENAVFEALQLVEQPPVWHMNECFAEAKLQLEEAVRITKEQQHWKGHAVLLLDLVGLLQLQTRSLFWLDSDVLCGITCGMTLTETKARQQEWLQKADELLHSCDSLQEGRLPPSDAGQIAQQTATLRAQQQRLNANCSNERSHEEDRMVFAAMGPAYAQSAWSWNNVGHWFSCRNCQLVYLIGECGGAAQETPCPQCRTVIGGRNHANLDAPAAQFLAHAQA